MTTNAFGYNLRSEVISAMMGSDQFGYGYDPIGNRLTATNNTSVTSYFANELNQYTNIVAGASVTPTYDDDGNMLAFGNGWTATWDGENRLAQISNFQFQISYTYDHQSRRIARQTAAGTEVFSYDDWAMIRHTAPGGAKTDYIYGLDLSGTPQGAGTVGGLLSMVRAGDTAPISYGYDANGNVTLLADGAGAVAARYAYDPFGNTLSATGTLASANPFRFSTKYCEDEVGLYYYGYRYYSTELGRWLSRDPIGEADTPNSHEFVLNAPVNQVDFVGLWTVTREGEARAEVMAERDQDSFDDLARLTGLDKSCVRWWLAPYKAQNEVKNCDKFTIPNTIIVAIGNMNNLAHFTVEGTARDVKSILERKKYSVLYHDYKTAPFGADAIRHPDLYGLVLFGHGVGGAGGKFNFWWHNPMKGSYVIFKDGLIIDDNDNSIVVPSVNYPDRSMGLFIGKFCYAEQGGWDSVVSVNGKKWIGSGLEVSAVTWGIRATAEAVPGN